MTVQAQGLVRGAREGADDGRAADGAIVGCAIDAAIGTVNGILGIDDRPRFRIHVRSERQASYAYDGDVRVGTVVLSAGVSDYDVPEECGAHGQRYTVVNGHTVLVERGSGRIVDIIEQGIPGSPLTGPRMLSVTTAPSKGRRALKQRTVCTRRGPSSRQRAWRRLA